MCIVLIEETKPTHREVKKIIQSLIYNKMKIKIYINKILQYFLQNKENVK